MTGAQTVDAGEFFNLPHVRLSIGRQLSELTSMLRTAAPARQTAILHLDTGKFLLTSYTDTHRHTDRHTHTQTDGQTDRHTGRQTDRQTDTYTQTDRQTDRQTDSSTAPRYW